MATRLVTFDDGQGPRAGALLDGGRRVRRRGERRAPDSDTDGETRDPAAAI